MARLLPPALAAARRCRLPAGWLKRRKNLCIESGLELRMALGPARISIAATGHPMTIESAERVALRADRPIFYRPITARQSD
jgi:hypothetical protein